MAARSRVPPSQRRALARLSGLALANQVYLAGGGAVALHLGHRVSADIDLFTRSPDLDLDLVQRELLEAPRDPLLPRGLTTPRWRSIRTYFEEAARVELAHRAAVSRR